MNLLDFQELVIVHTGASGGLGKLMVEYCNYNNIKLINVVRKQENVNLLKGYGAEHILNSSSETYNEDMKKVFEELKPTVLLDCVSGKTGSNLLRAMPMHSVLVAYGSLEEDPYDLTAKEIRFSDYKILGMTIMSFFKKYPQFKQVYQDRIAEYANDGKLKLVISKKFNQKDYLEAIDYYKKNMSAGKVILQP